MNGCFVNGSLHWIVKRYTDGHCFIMTFDVRSHVFGSIELPEPGSEAKLLMIINGSLALVSGKGDQDWIWIRREYINSHSWHVDLKFEKNQLEGVIEFLQLNTNGDILISYLQRFHVYNPQKEEQSEVNFPSRRIEIKMCIESLELINQGATVYFTEQEEQEHLPPGQNLYSITTTSQQKTHVDLRTLSSKKLSKVCKLFSKLKKIYTWRRQR
ncbi:F-box/kelch-repeat protein-like protein [Tanacetum coccineum]